MHRGRRVAFSTVVLGGLLAASLTACDPGEAGAREAAEKLTEALTDLDVSGIGFSGVTDGAEVNEKLKALTEPLAPARPTVTLKEVSQADGSWDTAHATLQYDWSLPTGSWTYQTTATLSRSGGGQGQSQGWRTAWSPELLVPGLKEGSILQVRRAPGPRGRVLGDEGAVIVEERPVLNIGIDKTKLDGAPIEASARVLAALVEVDPAGYAAQVTAAGPRAFVRAITLRDDANRKVNDEQISAIPGAVAIRGMLPLAPSRDFARALLGTVGEATAELIEASAGRVTARDETGLSGLQKRYDAQLSGVAGVTVVEVEAEAVDGAGQGQERGTRTLFRSEPVAGKDLQISLNVSMQQLAESLLANEQTPSSIVAIRASTGAVLAAANSPGSKGYNTALQGRYAPGSTFKIVTALAMLRQGATPQTLVECPARISAGGTSFTNYPGYPQSALGRIPLRLAFANSCNTAFIGAAQKLSQEDLRQAAAALGVSVPAPLGAESFDGLVPGQVTEAEHAASVIGQGKVLVSPMTMATVAASVGRGSLVSPVVVLDTSANTATDTTAPSSQTSSALVSSPSAGLSTGPLAKPTAARPLTASEHEALRSLMAAVVETGNAGPLKGAQSGPVIAKTGTAEFGVDNPPKTHGWLVAVQGDLAVSIFVETAEGFASEQLAPVMQRFLAKAAAG